MAEILETPKRIEKRGHALPTILCPRCNRAMAVKRIKKEVKSAWGNQIKFFLRYSCKDCGTLWEEEEKPERGNWAAVAIAIVIIFFLSVFIFMMLWR